MKKLWEERYQQKEYAYGVKPNQFLREVLTKRNEGKLLLPAEGEGRNATYAAFRNWEVEAFDISEEGRKKAMKLAEDSKVSFLYQLSDYNSFEPKTEPFDLIALIYSHSDPVTRRAFHRKAVQWLKPGGELILEGFSKNQLGKASGGPKNAEMLWSVDELKEDFESLRIEYAKETTIILNEGKYHQGEASVVRLIAKKCKD